MLLNSFLLCGVYHHCVCQGLKTHAVTMFEVGKLSDESLDSLLAELHKVPFFIRCGCLPLVHTDVVSFCLFVYILYV